MIRIGTGIPATGPAGAAAPAAVPAVQVTDAAPERPGIPMLNPKLRIDAELNLVVLEFRDAGGQLEHSIPSPRELDAYRVTGVEDPASPAPFSAAL